MTKVCVMRATFLSVIAGCLLGIGQGLAFAAEQTTLFVADHPEMYRVQEGDTLWDIAGRFLHDPWRWTEVWQASEDIDDPHLIYPGDIIIFSEATGGPTLHVKRGDRATQETRTKDGVVILKPRVRVLPASKAIPTIPYNVIAPFLSKTKVMPAGTLEHAPKIIAVDEDRLLVSEGNRFYTKRLPNKAGEILSVVRSGEKLKHPITGKNLGEVAPFLGTAKVEAHAQKTTSFIVQNNVEEMLPGDKLCPVKENRIEPFFFPRLPSNFAHGYILKVLGGINQVSQSQVVIISGGRDLQRQEGDVLAIYQTHEDLPERLKKKEKFKHQIDKSHEEIYEFPPIDVGRMIVFKVFDQTSLALVMEASRAIYLHDEVQRP